MTRAVKGHRAGEAIVIPLIVRPCSWQQTPLGAVKAIPRNGKPVSKYDDSDDAWHEVEAEIRRLIEDLNSKKAGAAASQPSAPTTAPPRAPASAAVKLPRSFSDADRDDFVAQAFDKIAYGETVSAIARSALSYRSRSEPLTPTFPAAFMRRRDARKRAQQLRVRVR